MYTDIVLNTLIEWRWHIVTVLLTLAAVLLGFHAVIWVRIVLVASSVLWLVELEKVVLKRWSLHGRPGSMV